MTEGKEIIETNKTHSDVTKRYIKTLPDLITLLVCLLIYIVLNEHVACRKKFRKQTTHEGDLCGTLERNVQTFQIDVHFKLFHF